MASEYPLTAAVLASIVSSARIDGQLMAEYLETMRAEQLERLEATRRGLQTSISDAEARGESGTSTTEALRKLLSHIEMLAAQ